MTMPRAASLGRMVLVGVAVLGSILLGACAGPLRGTGDLGIVVERATGSVLVIDTTARSVLGRVEGLGDLSHASAVFSRDGRHAYVFGRDGGLTKVDLLQARIAGRTIQGGNSIGGAISQDGRHVAVANYAPGGMRVFDSATLAQVADIPAIPSAGGAASKTVGLVDAPGRRFVLSLYDAGEIWLVDFPDAASFKVHKYPNAGTNPYDALITPDGRNYIAGLFGDDHMTLLDLWRPEAGLRKILKGYREGDAKLPVYKMPHLEGWTVAGTRAFFPAVGAHQVLVADTASWTLTDRIPVQGQPIFVVSRPDGRHAWVNFALPDNDTIQVIDIETRKVVQTIKPGKGVMHMEFTPRGEEVWVSVRDEGKVVVYDAETYARVRELPAVNPSGIFFTARGQKTGY